TLFRTSQANRAGRKHLPKEYVVRSRVPRLDGERAFRTACRGVDRKRTHRARTMRAPSLHGRHYILGAVTHARRPAGGHRLQPGVETHALGAMHMHIAEQGAFPSAETVKRHWRWNRHVHANHA